MLSCGHPPTPRDANSGATGEAILPNGDRICYACADALERARLATSDVAYAYLTPTGVRTWSGGLLATVTRERVRKVGFHGSTRTYFDAVTPDGALWHGISPGHGMYCTLRRSKRSGKNRAKARAPEL